MGHLFQSISQIENLDAILKSAGVGGDGKNLGAAFQRINKSISDTTVPGLATQLTEINLDEAVKHLYPIQTPFLNANLIGQVGGQHGDSRKYRGIAGFNRQFHSGAAAEVSTTNDGRGKTVDLQTFPRERFFSKLAPGWKISRELAQLSGALKAYAQETIASLANAKILEEQNMLFSVKGAIGPPTGLALVASASGGSLATDAAYTVYVTALNVWGQQLFENATTGADIPALVAGARPAESSNTNAAVGVTGPTGSIAVTWNNLKGAWAYAVYVQKGAGAIQLVGLTGWPSFTVTNLLYDQSGTSVIASPPTVDSTAVDNDGITVGYDGLYSQIVLDPDIPGYYLPMSATGFTPVTGGSGNGEMESVFEFLWRRRGVSPTCVAGNTLDWKGISAGLTSATAQNYRVNTTGEAGARIAAGVIVDQIKNQYSRDVVDVILHPLMPRGKLMFYTRDLPFENNNTGVNLSHFYNERMRQVFFARTEDVAEPGPWAISTIGTPILTWPRACAVIEGFKV